jgi:hypothetical protein
MSKRASDLDGFFDIKRRERKINARKSKKKETGTFKIKQQEKNGCPHY